MTKRQFQWAITIFVGIVVVIGGAILLIWQAFGPLVQDLPFGSNNRIVPFHEHFGMDPHEPTLISDNTRYAHRPMLIGDVVYVPASFLRDAGYDQFLFWDDFASVLFVTTRDDILAFYPEQQRFYVNGTPQTMENHIRWVGDDILLPASMVEALYPIAVSFQPAYNMVVLEDLRIPRTTAELTRRGDIRYREDNRAPITARMPAGSTLVIFGESGEFTRVRNEDGLLGWVLTAHLGEPTTVNPLDELEREWLLGQYVNNAIHHPPNWPANTPVVMAWDSVYNQTANANMMQNPLDPSLNVISPMWFRLDEETMSITSLANREYVEWAQASGVQVWPYVFDVFYNHSHAILTNREARQRVIDTLVQYVDELGLDGINIGFEHIRPPDGPYLIQFLRELAPPLRERGVVLSKNVLVPRPYTAFYRRDLMAYTVDFIAIMAYDEHWHSAPQSGPVASLPFVQRGIEDALALVPAEQLILGLPFYNRMWREVIGDNTPETRTRRYQGTAYVREWFEYNGAQWEWMPEIGKYYGDFPALEDGVSVLWRVWLEDERSMELKLQQFWGYGLAGVSVWNRNFRNNEGLWELMGQHFVD